MAITTDSDGNLIDHEITYEPNDHDRLWESDQGFYFRSRISVISVPVGRETGKVDDIGFHGQTVVTDDAGEPVLDANGEKTKVRHQIVVPMGVVAANGKGQYKQQLREQLCHRIEGLVADLTELDASVEEL